MNVLDTENRGIGYIIGMHVPRVILLQMEYPRLHQLEQAQVSLEL